MNDIDMKLNVEGREEYKMEIKFDGLLYERSKENWNTVSTGLTASEWVIICRQLMYFRLTGL